MTIQEVKKYLNLTDADIAEIFGYKNAASYSHATRKAKIEAGIVRLYELILERAGKKIE